MKVGGEGGVWSYQDNGCAARGIRDSRLWPHCWAVASAGAGRELWARSPPSGCTDRQFGCQLPSYWLCDLRQITQSL